MKEENYIVSPDQNLINEFAKNYVFINAPDFNCCNDTCAFRDRGLKFCQELEICIPEARKDKRNGYFKRIRR